jgi:hypothetical protein
MLVGQGTSAGEPVGPTMRGWCVMRDAIRAAALFVAFFMLATGSALAAPPAITEHGILNPVAWGIASMQTTRVFAKTDTAGAWARIDVLDYRGVVRTLYDGPAAAPGSRTWSRLFDGRGADGRMLPTGNYNYRIRITKGGATTSVSGLLPVSRNRFSITTDRDVSMLSRYLYAGLTRVYGSASYSGGGFLSIGVRQPDSTTVFSANDDLPFSSGTSSWSVAYRYTEPSASFHRIDVGCTSNLHDPSAPPWPPIAGTVTYTFMQ